MTLSIKQVGAAALLGLAAISSVFAQSAAAGSHAIIRGEVQSFDGKSLKVTTPTGLVDVAVGKSLTLYASQNSDLAHVENTSFVGVTSVQQPDGTELAKEIHIFPELMRGTGEGSHMMDAPAAASGTTAGRRMTNGSVSGARIAGGARPGSRMTNGTVKSGAGGTQLTLHYGDSSRVITVPPNVTVTAIVPVQATLAPGMPVTVFAVKDAGGTLRTDTVRVPNPPSKS